MLSQAYNIIIDRDASTPGHDREVLDEPNITDKSVLFQSTKNVQLLGSNRYDTQMSMHYKTHNVDVSLAPTFLKIL